MVACVAGVRKEKGRELGRENTRAQIPSSPSIPLLTPATQAICMVAGLVLWEANTCPNKQTSVNFRNFAELYLRSLKTNDHVQFWQFY